MGFIAYIITKAHSAYSSRVNQLLLIIGIAWTDKTFLINAIWNLLQPHCAVTATTGNAFYKIEGKTIHSLLN